jgi:hypothetical protein
MWAKKLGDFKMSKEKIELESSGSSKTKRDPIIIHEELKKQNPYTEEEKEALKQKVLSDGRVIDPIIVWDSKQYLVWGYEELAIAHELGLPYEIKKIEFETKADCLAWIAEKRMSIPILNMLLKIKIGKCFVDYWEEKDKDKNGEESPLKKAAMERCGRADKLAIIAIKAGTSHNTVNKANRILESGNQDIIDKCQNGEISISKAYDCINVESDTNDDSEATPEEVVEAEAKKANRKQRQRQKEINTLAKYSTEGFSATNEKLDKHGLKFFILRWNEEHSDSQIDGSEVQQVIDHLGSDGE